MGKATDLIMAISAATGIELNDVGMTARRLRESDLFVRETRGPKSARPTARHAANLICALAVGGPVVDAARIVERFENIFLVSSDPEDVFQDKYADLSVADIAATYPFAGMLVKHQTVLDAVAYIIATQDFEPMLRQKAGGLYIDFENQHRTASIYCDWAVEFSDDNKKILRTECSAQFDYANASAPAYGGITRTSRVRGTVLSEAARILGGSA